MNRTAYRVLTEAVVAFILASPALAADTGFYLTVGAGQAEEEPKSIGTNIGIGFPISVIVHVDPDRVDVDSSGVAWNVGIGYRLNPYLAGEVEYLDFSSTDVTEHYSLDPPVSPPFPSDFTHRYSSKVTGPALSVLGLLPMRDNVDVFLRAGALFADRELEIPRSIGLNAKFGSTVWLAGVGVDWSIADRWAIRAEYLRTGKLEETFFAGETELKRISLSATVRVGSSHQR
jgi:opacity protein-like surface antigen